MATTQSAPTNIPASPSDESSETSAASLAALQKQAQSLQAELSQALEKATTVRDEYSRLKTENNFLQEYIGNLLSTGNLINK